MSSIIFPSNESSIPQCKDLNSNSAKPTAEHPYRAVPLSTRQIFGIIAFLSIFSFIYLIYAQHHKLLFYVMTGLIAAWIAFIYTAGILAVLYMVNCDYVADTPNIEEKESQESTL